MEVNLKLEKVHFLWKYIMNAVGWSDLEKTAEYNWKILSWSAWNYIALHYTAEAAAAPKLKMSP